MKSTNILTTLILASTFASAIAESQIEKEFDSNGRLKHSFEILEFPKGTVRGIIREYYTNGVLKVLTPIKEASGELGYGPDGEVKTFYSSGQLQSSVHFSASKENGTFSRFYQNGERRSDGVFSNGAITSVVRFDRSGRSLPATNHVHFVTTTDVFTQPELIKLYCDFNTDRNGRLAWVFLYRHDGSEWIEEYRGHDFSPQSFKKGETRILELPSKTLRPGSWKCKLTYSVTGKGMGGKFFPVESKIFAIKNK